MAKPLLPETIAEFHDFCVATLQEDGSGYFCLGDFEPFQEVDEDGESLWEFHASNYNPDTTWDFYELFLSVRDEYSIEQHGYDRFYVVPV